MSALVTWETVTAAIGVVALVLEWLRARGLDGHTKERLDDHEQRLRVIERARP
jgi:hypothetical protein